MPKGRTKSFTAMMLAVRRQAIKSMASAVKRMFIQPPRVIVGVVFHATLNDNVWPYESESQRAIHELVAHVLLALILEYQAMVDDRCYHAMRHNPRHPYRALLMVPCYLLKEQYHADYITRAVHREQVHSTHPRYARA